MFFLPMIPTSPLWHKSAFVVFGRMANDYPWLKELDIDDSVVSRRKVLTYLGILIDETMCFAEHIQFMSLKIARNVGLLRRLKFQFPQKVLRLQYFLLIHPYLLYCCSILSNTFLTHLKQLQSLQKHTMRVIHVVENRISVRSIYSRIQLLPFSG